MNINLDKELVKLGTDFMILQEKFDAITKQIDINNEKIESYHVVADKILVSNFFTYLWVEIINHKCTKAIEESKLLIRENEDLIAQTKVLNIKQKEIIKEMQKFL
jgi:hypothetical protein